MSKMAKKKNNKVSFDFLYRPFFPLLIFPWIFSQIIPDNSYRSFLNDSRYWKMKPWVLSEVQNCFRNQYFDLCYHGHFTFYHYFERNLKPKSKKKEACCDFGSQLNKKSVCNYLLFSLLFSKSFFKRNGSSNSFCSREDPLDHCFGWLSAIYIC